MTTGEQGAASPHRRIRLIVWIAAAVLAMISFARGGIDFLSIALVAILIPIGMAAQFVETRTQRPLRTYLRGALASLMLALVFVAMPLVMGAGLATGLLLWGGVSIAALIWCIHYERTEAR